MGRAGLDFGAHGSHRLNYNLTADAVIGTEPMQTIVLVRHAAATSQDANAALTIEGRRQANLLADLLLQFQIQRVISSPFVRAIESAEPFCRRAGLRLETDDRLVERVLSARQDLPDWRDHLGRSFDDPDYCLEGGESSRTARQFVLEELANQPAVFSFDVHFSLE
jgi:broad specificity phosphatase PhoE